MIEAPARPVTTPLPEEKVTPIKPSEALRLGRLTRPKQRAGSLFWGDQSACALGAMALGWGYDMDPDSEVDDLLYDRLFQYTDHQWGETFHLYDDIASVFDGARSHKHNGDDAVLDFLAEKGL